jgi:DNA-binding NarL/FixJ family response regulator
LKKIDANVKVIIASGYAKDQQIRDMMEQGCRGFIQKPFSINELSQKILDVLND